MEMALWKAVARGDATEVARLLPTLTSSSKCGNVNYQDKEGWTALHTACSLGHEAIVSLLLAHPDINVNSRNRYGRTPFAWAIFNGKTGCVRLLLRDLRVRVNEADLDGHTPLKNAALFGHVEIIRWWIVSGREMDFGIPGNPKSDAAGIAKKEGRVEVLSLLRKFKMDPRGTMLRVRIRLRVLDELAAEIFALVVLLCDDFVRVTLPREGDLGAGAARFLRIVGRLPMELQMVVCRRVVGSSKGLILAKDAERAFRTLARKFHHGS